MTGNESVENMAGVSTQTKRRQKNEHNMICLTFKRQSIDFADILKRKDDELTPTGQKTQPNINNEYYIFIILTIYLRF